MPDANEPRSVTRTVPEGSVVITPTAMYMELQKVGNEVRHISTLLDPSLADIHADMQDHEVRIRAVERRVWAAAGMAALLAGSGGALLMQFYGG